MRSLNWLATVTASWPVMASTTRSVWCTSTLCLISSSSTIISSSTCNRPAVSIITTFRSFLRACSTAAFAMSTGFWWSPMAKTSTCCFSPLICSCLIAAGRYTSQATSSGRFPFSFSFPAIFAAAVVLPAPWRPHIIIVVIALPGWNCNSVVSDPIRAIISSLTILITICPGFSPFMTSEPIARSSTDLMNCLTTLKLTSASNSAILTSFSAILTSSSVRRPLLFSFLNTFWSLSVRLSKAIP